MAERGLLLPGVLACVPDRRVVGCVHAHEVGDTKNLPSLHHRPRQSDPTATGAKWGCVKLPTCPRRRETGWLILPLVGREEGRAGVTYVGSPGSWPSKNGGPRAITPGAPPLLFARE